MIPARAIAATAAATGAFAANSLLWRMPLGTGVIDPASFAAVRVLTAALALSLICGAQRHL